jgi:hypothetical protein
VYHFQAVASLREPLVMLKVLELPMHTGFTDAAMVGIDGAVQIGEIVTPKYISWIVYGLQLLM